MKAAVVLDTRNSRLADQAGAADALLSRLAPALSRVELWLFHTGSPPETVPEIAAGHLSGIRFIPIRHDYPTETCLDRLVQLTAAHPADLLLFTGDRPGEELAARLAFRLGGSAGLKIETGDMTPDRLVVTKPVYGSNLTARLVLKKPPFCLSLATVPGLRPVPMAAPAAVKAGPACAGPPEADWIMDTLLQKEPPASGLTQADFILAIGQGVKDRKTAGLMHRIAGNIGAELGGSRQAVMNAWVDMNRLIGVSGHIVSPKLCIAAGISGSAVFRAGIRNSGCIVAINTDADAPIFKFAHIGIVADLKPVLLELEKQVMSGGRDPGIDNHRTTEKEP